MPNTSVPAAAQLRFVAAGCALFGALSACSGSSGSGGPGPTEPPADQRPGNLQVTISTSGEDMPDGFPVLVDPGDEPRGQYLDNNEVHVFPNLFPGEHTVSISGLSNCTLAGPNLVTVIVPAGGTARVRFDITCTRRPSRADYTIQFSGDIVSGPIDVQFFPDQLFRSYANNANVVLTLPSGILAGSGPGGLFPGSGCTYTDQGDPNRMNTWGRVAGTWVGQLHGNMIPTSGFSPGHAHIDFQGTFVPDPSNPTTKKPLNLAVNEYPAPALSQVGTSTVLAFTKAQAFTSITSEDPGADPCVSFTITATPK